MVKERQAEEGVRNKFMRCQKEDMRNILQMWIHDVCTCEYADGDKCTYRPLSKMLCRHCVYSGICMRCVAVRWQSHLPPLLCKQQDIPREVLQNEIGVKRCMVRLSTSGLFGRLIAREDEFYKVSL